MAVVGLGCQLCDAHFSMGGSFLVSVRSLLLTVENWFGLFYLQLKFGLVFFAYGGKLVWSFYLRFPPARNWVSRKPELSTTRCPNFGRSHEGYARYDFLRVTEKGG